MVRQVFLYTRQIDFADVNGRDRDEFRATRKPTRLAVAIFMAEVGKNLKDSVQ